MLQYEPFPALNRHPIDDRKRIDGWREKRAKGYTRYFTKVYITIYSVHCTAYSVHKQYSNSNICIQLLYRSFASGEDPNTSAEKQ